MLRLKFVFISHLPELAITRKRFTLLVIAVMSNPNEQTNLVLVQAVKCASCPAMAVYRCHECEKTVCVRHMREVEQREGRVVYTRSFCTECAPKVEVGSPHLIANFFAEPEVHVDCFHYYFLRSCCGDGTDLDSAQEDILYAWLH